jgi:hypothetical protein
MDSLPTSSKEPSLQASSSKVASQFRRSVNKDMLRCSNEALGGGVCSLLPKSVPASGGRGDKRARFAAPRYVLGRGRRRHTLYTLLGDRRSEALQVGFPTDKALVVSLGILTILRISAASKAMTPSRFGGKLDLARSVNLKSLGFQSGSPVARGFSG